jgi:broad specificity phosphatase PhoE
VGEAVNPGRIIMVRHGRPSLSRDQALTADEYMGWWRQYDAAGLAEGERPPERLIELARDSHLIYSSTLRRAQETAQHLASGRDVTTDRLFVEVPLPRPPVPMMRCGPTNWGWIARTFWTLGYSPNSEGVIEAFKRANEASDRLIDTASASGTVLVCAHGFFNWMVSVTLRNKGWRPVYNDGYTYWSWQEFEKI